MASNLESWRLAAYNAVEYLAGCLTRPEIAEHLDQAAARTVLEDLIQVRIEMLAAREAAQLAAGDPVYQWHDETAWQECNSKREYLHAKDNGIRVRTLWTAPPAAAHGDEAVLPARKSGAPEWDYYEGWYQDGWNDCLDEIAAMRAQGEGGAA